MSSDDLDKLNEQIERLQTSINFKRKAGSGAYTNLIPSLNKLKSERDNIIANFETNKLKAQIENNKKKLESLSQQKYEAGQLLEQAKNTYNYLKINPQILN